MIVLLLLAAASSAPTVQDRVMEDSRTVRVSIGAAFLTRYDLNVSIGGNITVSHYFSRNFGIDYLSANGFYTFETAEAERIRELSGYTSQREKPYALVGPGIRVPFGYGKVLIGSSVIHFIPEAFVHVGIMITNRGVRPAADLGLALRIHIGPRWSVGIDYAFVGSIENARPVFVPGGLPRLSLGFSL